MQKSKDPQIQAMVLAELRRCADAGERAPHNYQFDGGSALVGELVDQGLIKVEVYAKNWRVIEFPDGSRTMEPPFGNTGPYLVKGA